MKRIIGIEEQWPASSSREVSAGCSAKLEPAPSRRRSSQRVEMPPSKDSSPPPAKRRKVLSSKDTSSRAASDELQIEKVIPDQAKKAIRIFSWNIDGVTPFLPPTTQNITTFLITPPKRTPSTRPSLRACLRRWSWPHILCLQEVKIAPWETKTVDIIKRVVNSPIEEEEEEHNGEQTLSRLYDAHFCLPRDKYNATGFGGKVHGVCTLIRRDLSNVHTKTVDWDLEGRVLISELASDGLAVINVYAVNGTSYDYRDSTSGKVIGTRHDRKRAFHSHLRDEVRSYEQHGWDVLVIGDINISRTKTDSFPQLRMGKEHVKNRADFEEKFIEGLGMVDTFRFVHGQKKKYSVRPTDKPWGEGGDRVDMGLITQGLTKKLRAADILDTPEERGTSDHLPLFVELTLERKMRSQR